MAHAGDSLVRMCEYSFDKLLVGHVRQEHVVLRAPMTPSTESNSQPAVAQEGPGFGRRSSCRRALQGKGFFSLERAFRCGLFGFSLKWLQRSFVTLAQGHRVEVTDRFCNAC